jgi:hypothetical protein
MCHVIIMTCWRACSTGGSSGALAVGFGLEWVVVVVLVGDRSWRGWMTSVSLWPAAWPVPS